MARDLTESFAGNLNSRKHELGPEDMDYMVLESYERSLGGSIHMQTELSKLGAPIPLSGNQVHLIPWRGWKQPGVFKNRQIITMRVRWHENKTEELQIRFSTWHSLEAGSCMCVHGACMCGSCGWHDSKSRLGALCSCTDCSVGHVHRQGCRFCKR